MKKTLLIIIIFMITVFWGCENQYFDPSREVSVWECSEVELKIEIWDKYADGYPVINAERLPPTQKDSFWYNNNSPFTVCLDDEVLYGWVNFEYGIASFELNNGHWLEGTMKSDKDGFFELTVEKDYIFGKKHKTLTFKRTSKGQRVDMITPSDDI